MMGPINWAERNRPAGEKSPDVDYGHSWRKHELRNQLSWDVW